MPTRPRLTLATRDLGFGGKLCIHPSQVAIVRDCFTPSEKEISWARKILASGDDAAALDGDMIDEPVRARARGVLVRAGQS